MELDVPETSSVDAVTPVGTFEAVKNSNINPSKLAINGDVTYNIVSAKFNGDSGLCEITKDDFKFDGGNLNIHGDTDYETCKAGITMQVFATANFDFCEDGNVGDPCTEQASEVCEVNVRMRNTNEPPVWQTPQENEGKDCFISTKSSGEFVFEVYERTSEFTEFGEMLEKCVSDPDEGETISFSIEESDAPSSGSSLFNVKQCGGMLFVRENADLAYTMGGSNSYVVTVVAQDLVGDTAKQEVTVNVLNLNDPPTFNSSMSTKLNIDENQEIGEEVYNPTPKYAIDLDNDVLMYSLDLNTDDAFDIDPSSGIIRTKMSFDYETKNSYLVQIRISDGKGEG